MKTTELVRKIESGALDAVFEKLYGAKDAGMQKARYVRTIHNFEADYGTDRDVSLFSVPGRSEISGNHTDHNHGCVLAAAINLDIIAVAAKNDDGLVRLRSEGYSEDRMTVAECKTPNADFYFKSRALTQALRAVGGDMATVRAVFVTHEHADHTSALEMLAKKYDIPIHITEGSAVRLLPAARYLPCRAVLHTPLFSVQVGGMTVSSFVTPHDSDMSVGYTVTLADGRKLAYATDIGHVTPEIEASLAGAYAVVLESNHDEDMLMRGPYPAWLKSRIASDRGHLSNAACDAFLPQLSAQGTAHVLLAHLSAENNTPARALEAACAACPEMHIVVARESEPTRLL